ncbi:hypothetical protein JG688_00018238 [Phytophthora aleatoria]|uniref:Uncharacterized protein n=1 Tax=Phytophthora aleatoria TaxID=2496075 RepID=A0A8J5IRQ0_9STRA|nr:hypothetical protein JG688_00018238 [Phytophthora aleatoria]
MEEEEVIVVGAYSAVTQAIALYAESSALRFEPMLQSAAYARWFEDNLYCATSTFLQVARFLQEHGIRFAAVNAKQHSYEEEIAAALYYIWVSRWVQRG